MVQIRNAALLAVVAFGVAGCGSSPNDDTASSTGAASSDAVPADVSALAAAAQKAQPWAGPTTSPLIAKNKFVVAIPCGKAAEGCNRIANGVLAAAKAAGWRSQEIDPALDQNKTIAAINQAVSLGADGIAINSTEPALVKSAVANARKKGVVVVNANAGREDATVTASSVQHDVPLGGIKQGNALGASVCQQTDGKANLLGITDPQVALLLQRWQGSVETFKKCPGIKYELQKISVSDIGTTLQSKMKALLAANPDVDTLWSSADAYVPDMLTAIQSAGLANKISVYSFDGNAQVVDAIKAGGPMKATMGGALEQQGWAQVDDINRLLQKQEPATDGIPSRLITKDYIPEGGAYAGDVDYQANYKSLWTTGKLPQ